MTAFERIKQMDIDEFAKWFNDNCTHDDDPVIRWWNHTYCNVCEPEISRFAYSDEDMEFCWCELHDKCRFFQDMDNAPDNMQMVKLWLESEW